MRKRREYMIVDTCMNEKVTNIKITSMKLCILPYTTVSHIGVLPTH